MKIAIPNREFDPIRQRLKAGSISVRQFAVEIVARAHFRGITTACVWITGEIIAAYATFPSRKVGSTPNWTSLAEGLDRQY
jgi:hypothetical protein